MSGPDDGREPPQPGPVPWPGYPSPHGPPAQGPQGPAGHGPPGPAPGPGHHPPPGRQFQPGPYPQPGPFPQPGMYPPPKPYPPQFQPPGPYPSAAQGFPPPGGPFQPPGARRSRRNLVLALSLVAVVVMVLVVAGIVATYALSSSGTVRDIDDASVGDCVTVSGESDSVTPRYAKCDDAGLSYIVAEKLDRETATCSDRYSVSIRKENEGKLCLTPNLRVGKCYTLSGTSSADLSEVSCGGSASPSGKPVIRVVDRAQDSDPSRCGASEPLVYRKPSPLTYCLEALTSG